MKRLKWGLSFVLAMALLLLTAVPAFAATGLQDDGAAIITKRVLAPAGIATAPAMTYNFAFVPQLLEGSTTEYAPDIVNTAGTDNTWSIAFAGTEALSGGPDANGYYYADVSSTDILADTVFPYAGIYVYNITETAGSQPGTGSIAYSSQAYQMTVYVTRTANSGTDLEVSAVEFKTVASGVVGAKADPIFENIYTINTSLTISKTVSGTYSDPTKPFSYSLTLTAAPGVTSGTYIGAIYDSATSSYTGTATFTLSGNPPTATNTFTLAHGQRIEFDGNNGSTLLPVGTTYTLVETGAGGYTPSVVVSPGSIVTGTTISPATPAAGDSLTITDALLAVSANSAAFTNTYSSATPTGILMDNLPFVLLILAAIGGLVVYLVLKRRKARHG